MNNMVIVSLWLEYNSNKSPFPLQLGPTASSCLRSHWGSEWVRDSELTVAAKYTDYVLGFIMLRDQVNQQL